MQMKQLLSTIVVTLVLSVSTVGAANAAPGMDDPERGSVEVSETQNYDSEYPFLTKEQADNTSLEEQLELGVLKQPSGSPQSRAFPKNVSSICYQRVGGGTWYGMLAGDCKGAGGGKYVLFDTAKAKKIAEIDLTKVKATFQKNPSLGCIVSTASLVLTIPGSPTSTVGWALKGVQLILGAAGVKLSC